MTSKIALITGGSRGLGRNTALKLAEAGWDIVLTYLSADEEAQAVVHKIEKMGQRAFALPLDVGACESFACFKETLEKRMDEKFQTTTLDVLINNAGFGVYATCAETTEAQFDALMNVHLKGVFFLTQILLPGIRDGGRILMLSSGLTRFTIPGYGAYALMKGAIEVLVRYLAKELGSRGIRVNAIAAGAIETDFGGGLVRDNAELNAMIASHTALGRVGLPDDVGGAIALLVQDGAGWITGQRLEISGGQWL